MGLRADMPLQIENTRKEGAAFKDFGKWKSLNDCGKNRETEGRGGELDHIGVIHRDGIFI